MLFFNDTDDTEIYTLSLHDALPIWGRGEGVRQLHRDLVRGELHGVVPCWAAVPELGQVEKARRLQQAARDVGDAVLRSEEHTSELQSQSNLVCRLLLEKKKKAPNID